MSLVIFYFCTGMCDQETSKEQQQLWTLSDKDKDDSLSVDEFVQFSTLQWSYHRTGAAMQADTDGDHALSKTEILASLETFKKTIHQHRRLYRPPKTAKNKPPPSSISSEGTKTPKKRRSKPTSDKKDGRPKKERRKGAQKVGTIPGR